MRPLFWFVFVALFAVSTRACIWDADSLTHEKSRSHDLAAAILGKTPAAEDPQKLQARIKNLEAHRNEASAEWWNNLAGAYLRLNQSAQAAKILEPIMEKFPNDYGIHANLGTAYHLLGRYKDAEKEIARDLEINPNGHFGLEKYHLALLQYLVRGAKYQSRHVYVDEFTTTFLSSSHGNFYFTDSYERIFKEMAQDYTNAAEAEADYESFSKTNRDNYELMQMLGTVAVMDAPPPYRAKWNLATDTNFEAGVIDMAQLNPKEPACFTMLGVAAWKKRDYNLAVNAFEKAIALNSPQSEILKHKVEGLNKYIKSSLEQKRGVRPTMMLPFVLSALFAIGYYAYARLRDRRQRAPEK